MKNKKTKRKVRRKKGVKGMVVTCFNTSKVEKNN